MINTTVLQLTTLFMLLNVGFCSSCKDSDSPIPIHPIEEQLPPITTTGAGTFGCRVNGKVWVAKSNKTGWSSTYASISRNNDLLVHISGNILLDNSRDDLINLTFFYDSSNYYPLYLRKDNVPAGKYTDILANKFWRTDSLIGGGVTISKLDTLTQIISGIFQFSCIQKETQDTLHITEGRFDMHYTY
ncbi:MAG: DUF6252 family protein [Bacteroidota bacterium]